MLRYLMAYQLSPMRSIQHSRYDKVRVSSYSFLRDLMHARTISVSKDLEPDQQGSGWGSARSVKNAKISQFTGYRSYM
jgi:hypothetical protein